MDRGARRLAFLGALTGLLALSCVNVPIRRQAVTVVRYAIDPAPDSTRADTTLDLLLQVNPLQAGAEERGDRMLYSDDAGVMNLYFYNRWVAPPEKMIGDALFDDLTRWGLFGRGVCRPDAAIIPTHEIQGRVDRLYAANVKGHANATLQVSVTVLRVDRRTYAREIIYQRSFPVVVERRNRDVGTYVEASNQAVRRWLDQLRPGLEELFRAEARSAASGR